jgi:hypothetical protein
MSRETQCPGTDAVSSAEGNTFRTHHRKVRTAGVVEEPGMCRGSLDGNREIPGLGSGGAPLWPASGRRGAVADDERTWEVRLRNSSWEADELSRETGGGVGGAKCGSRGECEPAKHAPDAGPESVSQALERIRQVVTENRFAVTHPRWEPYARIGPVRICAGGRSVMSVPTAIRIDYSASQSGDWTCIRRPFRLVEFRSARPISP